MRAKAQLAKAQDSSVTIGSQKRVYLTSKHSNNVRQIIFPDHDQQNSQQSQFDSTANPNHENSFHAVAAPVIQESCAQCEQEIQLQANSKALPVGSPNDIYEQEADRVADSVISNQPVDLTSEGMQLLQREPDEVEEDIQAKNEPLVDPEVQPKIRLEPVSSLISEDLLQAQCAECEEELQLKPDEEQEDELQLKSADNPIDKSTTKPGIWQRIRLLFTRGQPMASQERSFFEQRMGHDFSNVRIHTDHEAAATATAIGARAYTYRNHVVFAPGEYQPQNQKGTHLYAHELTHVIQQKAVSPLLLESEQGDASVEVNTTTTPLQLKTATAQIQGDFFDDVGDLAGDAWDTAGDVVDEGLSVGADAAWAIVERIAPRALMDIINEVREKGFLGFIKEKVADAAASLFGGLSDQSGVLGTLFSTFTRLSIVAGEIIIGLANNDCEPLFNALGSLRDMVTELANDAFTAIADFFAPVGAFFSDLWIRVGAPVMDWLGEVASDTWSYIQNLGQQIWDWTRPIIDEISSLISGAWGWIKEKIGISSDSGNSSGGLIQWVKDKAGDAWQLIKTELQPVIQPVQQVIEKVQEILPLEAILNFRETVNGWLQQASSMAQNMDPQQGGNAADNQVSLRDEILPAILLKITEFRTSLINTGIWVASLIGGAVDQGQSFLTALSNQPLLTSIRTAFSWLTGGLTSLGNWARQTVQSLFTILGNGLVSLSEFIRPVLDALSRLVQVIGNLLGMLPDFLMGPVWWALPVCIKDVIKTFVIEQILSRIPLFQQLMSIGDIWTRLQQTAIRILQQVFLDGNFFGAMWTFFSTMLNLIGIPAQLVLQIIANAAQAFSDILMNPLGFFNNLLLSMWQGTSNFFTNILSHLFSGVSEWLFGQLDEAGITPPDITSFQSILTFVFELMGLSIERIWAKLTEHLDAETVERIRSVIEFAAGPFEFIYIAITEGVSGIWRFVQEQLSGLWNMVLGAVVQWINVAIIETGSRWLLSLLDVSGITPVINALIAVYRAIESFVQYINEMLQMIASVVQSLAEIAAGNLIRAAQFIENSFASSIPVIVGFLANQFGLGRLGERVRELVDALRERVDAALDWLISNAIRLGQSFINMIRSGVDMVRNWWDARKQFTAADGASHELYFQGENGDLIVESTPTPLGQYLNALSISEEDPQKTQKEQHKQQALRIYTEISDLKRTLQRRQSADEDISEQQNQLNTKFDQLVVHLTPLMVASVGDGESAGRIPNPLTLAALDKEPVTLPRSSEEETADLDAARQLIMLAKEQADGTAALSEYFARIRIRFALEEVAYHTQGEQIKIKLRASQQQDVQVAEPITTNTPDVNLVSNISYTSGTAAGDSVAVGMLANPVSEDISSQGSTPRANALAGVMSKLITDPEQSNPSKYIKGHLLNHRIGGPGTSENMYPITGQANSGHFSNIERQVETWVNTNHYWVYYQVQVQNISEHIPYPDQKHPENWINASFNCHAYVKYSDAEEHDPIRAIINSNYVQGNASTTSFHPRYLLDENINREMRNDITDAQLVSWVNEYSPSVSGFALGRANALIYVFKNPPTDADSEAELSVGRKNSITFINNEAIKISDAIRQGRTNG